LPAVSLKSGGNPELVGLGGELFLNERELLESIDKVAGNLNFYQNGIKVKKIEEIGREYVIAIKTVC
jgi:hypothetical protein